MEERNTIVSNFLRDSQYRVAELSIEMRPLKRDSSRYKKLENLRAQLILWMDCLYESRDRIYGDDYNYLGDWSDREIISECEYLRRISGMNDIGYITFAGFSPVIRNVITGDQTTGFPVGSENQYIRYDVNGNPIAEAFPIIGGMNGETIAQYFS